MKFSRLTFPAIALMTLVSCEKQNQSQSVSVGAHPIVALQSSKVEDSSKTFNSVCPITGEKVDPNVHRVDYKGKKIGFCCSGCDRDFSANPEKALKNLSPDGQKWIGAEKPHM